jgi:arylsulfatase
MKTDWLIQCFVYAGVLVLSIGSALAAQKPNVILVMTDDQGYGELSSHGNPILKTPHLDRLRSQSLRLTDFHVAPMCTPTRGQLMTGLDAARNGAINVSSGRTLLRADLSTMADFFAQNGYRTGVFGKWHLGDNYPYRPEDRGFHETLWFPSSHINSVPDYWDNDYFSDTYIRNGKREEFRGYCTDLFFSRAMAWMKERADRDESFFVYLPTNAPHGPHWVPKRYRSEMVEEFVASGFLDQDPELKRSLIPYLAMIRNIDTNIGELLSFLQDMNLSDNTVLIFTTDNGSTFGYRYFNAGMRGRKTELWEGGHRVPFFIRWPAGGFGRPRDIDGLTQVQDVLPTLIDLCGLITPNAPKFDGISLAPVLRGRGDVPENRMLVINYSRMPIGLDYPSPDSPSIMRRIASGVMLRRWRLLRETELYDLVSDPLQQTDVSDRYPEIAGQMRAHLERWWQEVEEKANEPQRIIIGSAFENPMLLTACEWLDVFVDQQRQIRVGERKNGYWNLEVAEAGEYEFELRRWPRETRLPLTAGLPQKTVTDGQLVAGVELPIARARVMIGSIQQSKPLESGAVAAVFNVQLEPGPVRLHTWFDDKSHQPICGAYYVYVERR